MDEAIAELRFDGQRHGGWQKVDIREAVDDLCATVNLSLAGQGPGDSKGATANTVADVLIGGQLATTIRPDNLRRSVTPDSHTIQMAARSLGRELVDCQYSITLSGLKLGEIVQRICNTFKVPVKIAATTTVVPEFSMQCEAPSNALINAVRAANLLLYATPDGGLILTEPTSAPPVMTLEYGKHFTRYEKIDEFKLRFSDYVVKSFDYSSDQALKGGAKDPGITYFRPMHIVADKASHGLGGCERRATLERNRRLARAHRIELEVPGWRYLDQQGKWQLWAINTRVRVVIPAEGIDDVFLIGERGFVQDGTGGSITNLQVMHRSAFVGQEPSKKGKRSGKKMKGDDE